MTIDVIFNKENLEKTLGEVLEANGKTQLRIAETEKYPHVTFFFSGGREKEFNGEKRLLCPSPKVATYDLKPEMSAHDITKAILKTIPRIWRNDHMKQIETEISNNSSQFKHLSPLHVRTPHY